MVHQSPQFQSNLTDSIFCPHSLVELNWALIFYRLNLKKGNDMKSAINSSTNRRSFLKRAGGMGGALVSTGLLPGILNSKEAPAVGKSLKLKPVMDYGVASGDILEDRAVIWSRADRPSRLFVEWATTEKMENPRRVAGPAALEQSDFTAKLDLSDLPVGQDIFYRVRFQSLEDITVFSDPVLGHFRTSPTVARKINLLWSGDTAGQGWGINPDWGGMRIYSAMAFRRERS